MKKQKIDLTEYTAAYTAIGIGKPVIFLHGFFGDGRTLEPIMRKLQDNYHCIGLDLLGFGDSSKPNIRYLIDRQVEFLHEFTTAQNLSNFHLVGYSYGAWVASAYAIAASKEGGNLSSTLEGMTLIAPAGIRDDSFAGRYTHLKPLLWDTKLVDLSLDAMVSLAALFGKDRGIKNIRQFRKIITSQPVAKSLLIQRIRPEDAVDTVEKDIDRITVPTLVIAAQEDKTIPFWHSQTYAEKIPQATLQIIPTADHDLIQTHSLQVADTIANYWQLQNAGVKMTLS
jgi:pimeloyl-ACP methyl ester carboxylesterase